jgi:hypothetical protein
VHAVRPDIKKNDPEHKIAFSLPGRVDVTLWTSEITPSLESEISTALKSEYPQLRECTGDNETIIAAIPLMGTTSDDVVRGSVKLLQKKPWFTCLCQRFRKYAITR